MVEENTEQKQPKPWLRIVLIGLATGYLSGIFAVGGGVIMVPALVAFAGFSQRQAAGTSLAAIIFPATAGVITYVTHGYINWLAAGILVVGSVVGAQIGTYLLNKLPVLVIRWAFVGFLLVSAVTLLFVVPPRGAVIDITVITAIALVAMGLVTGILAGLVGVGGGVVLVPGMIVGFGASDLIAKGTSLAVIIPTSVSGTLGNLRRRNVDLQAALTLGIAACLTSPLGVLSAVAIPARTGNYLFAAFQLSMAARMIMQLVRTSKG